MAKCGTKRQSYPKSQHLQDSFTDHTVGASPMMQVLTSPPGVSNCYVFKSRLQEYAQKVGLTTPVYETIKEGPSHQPSFTSTVIVGGVRYDSLSGFLNRKAAEQSAAEIALMDLSKCGQSKESISVPVHETGLCKNLLQDYTQKMNYAVPTYICKRVETANKTLPFSCTVEIGGIRYIGASAKTRKEAEIKAARTALLAIQSSASVSTNSLNSKPHHTVVPPKRKAPETGPSVVAGKPKKLKRSRFKKKRHNPQHSDKVTSEQIPSNNMDISGSGDRLGSSVVAEDLQNCLSDVQVPSYGGKVSEEIRPESVDVISDAQAIPDYEQTPHSSANSLIDTDESLKINQLNGEASKGDTDHERENTVVKNVGLTNQELGPLVLENKVSPKVPEPTLSDTNCETKESTAGTDVGPVIADSPAKQELGQPVSECKAADTNRERDENTSDTNVSPATADSPANHESGPQVSETKVIGLGEPELAKTEDRNQERDDCENDGDC